MNFAVVDPGTGVITNVVVGNDLETVQTVVGSCVQETEATGPPAIGYIWDGSVFRPPIEVEPEPALTGTMTPELEAALIAAGWAPPSE